NRIDDVLVFNSLEKQHIFSNIEIELKKLFSRIEDMVYSVGITDAAKDIIVNAGYDKQYGARPLKRAIQSLVEDVIAEEIINGRMIAGQEFLIDAVADGKSTKISAVEHSDAKE
ncbi:MAG: ATP-dependent Clp protease ATP-binding subunit, partial [Flavobacteriales bacterium]|nr:ATP-dependent Clp protease ATP-binding subunit [Flavobacteriales bacterium]